MKELLPVILFLITTICSAEGRIYKGSAAEFIPVSSQLGENWSRSLIRTVNEKNELKDLFQSAHPVESGPTTSYEVFRRKNNIRELSDVEYFSDDEALEKQTYQLAIFLFPNQDTLATYWKASHSKHLDDSAFTTIIEGHNYCIFRLQNIYVRVSSIGLSTECERIAGLVFNMIQHQQNGSNQSH